MGTDHRRLLNECPTVVGMLTTSIESGGSLDTAVRTVAEDGPPLSAEMFGKVVRSTDTKGTPGIPQGLTEAVGELPRSASGYKHAVLLCIAASETAGTEERLRLLKEASDVALDSVRTMGESYSSSLTVPCMTVFGLGIMVPMILMSIVPMLGIGGMFGSVAVSGDAVVALTIGVIPAVIMALTLWMRSVNPFISGTPGNGIPWGILPLLLAVPILIVLVDSERSTEDAMLLSLGPAAILTAIMMAGEHRREKTRRECEDGLKDSVVELGNGMVSGGTFESVCSGSLASRGECREIGVRLGRELDICRGDVQSAITNAFRDLSSDIRMAFCDIQRCSERDTRDAGRLAIALGRQFHNNAVVRKELELRLKSMTDMMTGTAVLFAPMVLGMSMSMLEPLSGLAGYQPIGDTGGVLSMYLVELCGLIAMLTSNLGGGESVRTVVWRFSLMVPVALLVFRICSGFHI